MSYDKRVCVRGSASPVWWRCVVRSPGIGGWAPVGLLVPLETGRCSEIARHGPDAFPVTACLWTIHVQGQCSATDGRGAWPVRDRELSLDELRTRTGLSHGLFEWTIVAQLLRDQWAVISREISRLAAQKSWDAARDASMALPGRGPRQIPAATRTLDRTLLGRRMAIARIIPGHCSGPYPDIARTWSGHG